MRIIKSILLLSVIFYSKAHGKNYRELFLRTDANSIYSKHTFSISVLPYAKWIIGNNVADTMLKYRIQLGVGLSVGYFPIDRIHLQAQYIYGYTFDNKFKPIYTNAFGISSKYVMLDKRISPIIKVALSQYHFKFFPTPDYTFYTNDSYYTWNYRNVTTLSVGIGGLFRIKRFTIGLNYLFNSTLKGQYSPLFQNFGYEGTIDYYVKLFRKRK